MSSSKTKEQLIAAYQSEWLDQGLRKIAEHKTSSTDLFLFIYAFQDLCVPGGEAFSADSKKLRSYAWQEIDPNDNGLVSLAEAGKWIQDRLINKYCPKKEAEKSGMDKSSCELLYKHFYPSYIRAHLDAADYGAKTKVTQKGGGKSYSNTKTTGDDYVQFREFRLLVSYLCIYATIWEAFGNIDGLGKGIDATDDRRISLDEWKKNRSLLIGHPLQSLSISCDQNPEKIFAAMDGDGKGKVLLAEFATYIEDFEHYLQSRWGILLNAGEKTAAKSAGTAVAAASAAE